VFTNLKSYIKSWLQKPEKPPRRNRINQKNQKKAKQNYQEPSQNRNKPNVSGPAHFDDSFEPPLYVRSKRPTRRLVTDVLDVK
jgi:hypothetical protein